MRSTFVAAVAALAFVVPAALAASVTAPPTPVPEAPGVRDAHRVVVYYQKHYRDDPSRTGYISALPLLTEDTGVDVINLAAIHMNSEVLNLNDDPPSDPMYDRMWDELGQMQDRGIAVVAMIGGAQNDTWPSLQADFTTQYARLRDFVTAYGLDGVDLDIELDEAQLVQGMTIDIDVVVDLIDALRTDFGPDFLITASPVASEFVSPDPTDPDADPDPDGMYGVDLNELYRQRGDVIDWFNMQAYCGHGDPTPDQYDEIIRYQHLRGADIPAQKLVIAAITDYDNCTSGGWVPIDELTGGLQELVASYPQFGGVAGWEYFNSQPGGTARPWEWAARMRAALDGVDPAPTTDTTTNPTTDPATDPTTDPTTTAFTTTTFPTTASTGTLLSTTGAATIVPAPVVVITSVTPGPTTSVPTATARPLLAATGWDVLPFAAAGAIVTALGAAALIPRRRTHGSR